MRNRFFGLRHGESLANRQALIVSDPGLGTQAFGLSSAGRTEIRTRCEEFAARLGHDVSIVASDFVRTKETAEILGEYLTVPLELNVLLRERYFGEWDRSSNTNYERVWQFDREDPSHRRWSVESVREVYARMRRALAELDARYVGRTIVLVSHGDPLQILWTGLAGGPLEAHRQLDPWGPGELRAAPCQHSWDPEFLYRQILH